MAGGVKVKMEKCNFFKKEVQYLGHIISADGLKMAPSRTIAITNYPRPKTKKEMKSFYCMLSHYRRFIYNFAARADPIHKATLSWDQQWTPQLIKTFEDLKLAISTAPILEYPS